MCDERHFGRNDITLVMSKQTGGLRISAISAAVKEWRSGGFKGDDFRRWEFETGKCAMICELVIGRGDGRNQATIIAEIAKCSF